MITRLRIDQFRKFTGYHLSDLRNVNLLVGENSSGKTTVLEAIHFLRTPEPCSVLTNQAWERGEVTVDRNPRNGHETFSNATIQHFFPNHRLEMNSKISASYFQSIDEATTRSLQIIGANELHRNSPSEQGVYGGRILDSHENSPASGHKVLDEFFIDANGIPSPRRWGGYPSIAESEKKFHVAYHVGDESLIELRGLWDALNQERREHEVYKILQQVLDPDIEDLFFEAGHNFAGNGRNGALIGYKGRDHRVPIGSLGNGVFQLLCMSVKLQWAANGIALFDEIGTGLHWSTMGEMWRLVIEAARQNNTQVFATTHSQDCIKGLAWVCENYPDLAEDISLQKIDPALDEAIALPGERIPFVIGQEIEVR